MKNSLLFFLFVCCCLNPIGSVNSMDNTTEACRCMQDCLAKARATKLVEAEQEFRRSLQDPHDDPGFYNLLSDIARSSGLGEQINAMWDEYGITDDGRRLLLGLTTPTLRQAISLSVQKK
jgi:hypothetical protein